MGHNGALLCVVLIFIPPLAVFLKGDRCSSHVWINVILLFLCFGIPAIVHAIWFCFCREPDPVQVIVVQQQVVMQPMLVEQPVYAH